MLSRLPHVAAFYDVDTIIVVLIYVRSVYCAVN